MTVLSEEYIRKTYFEIVGGFPSLPIIQEVQEYDGGPKACIACTQLPGKELEQFYAGSRKCYTKKEQKAVLKEWVDFLSSKTDILEAIHFNSYVPQELFDAACCQENLTELRVKWGGIKDLSGLKKLRKLRYLCLGSCRGLADLSPIAELKDLVVMDFAGKQSFTDYSALAGLKNLEQLIIDGPFAGGYTVVDDLEFLRQMPQLRSLGLGAVSLKRKYSKEELRDILDSMPDVHEMGSRIFKGV